MAEMKEAVFSDSLRLVSDSEIKSEQVRASAKGRRGPPFANPILRF